MKDCIIADTGFRYEEQVMSTLVVETEYTQKEDEAVAPGKQDCCRNQDRATAVRATNGAGYIGYVKYRWANGQIEP